MALAFEGGGTLELQNHTLLSPCSDFLVPKAEDARADALTGLL